MKYTYEHCQYHNNVDTTPDSFQRRQREVKNLFFKYVMILSEVLNLEVFLNSFSVMVIILTDVFIVNLFLNADRGGSSVWLNFLKSVIKS